MASKKPPDKIDFSSATAEQKINYAVNTVEFIREILSADSADTDTLDQQVSDLRRSLATQNDDIRKLKRDSTRASTTAGRVTFGTGVDQDVKDLVSDQERVNALIAKFVSDGLPKPVATKTLAMIVAGSMNENIDQDDLNKSVANLMVEYAKNHPEEILEKVPKVTQPTNIQDYLDLTKNTVADVVENAKLAGRGVDIADTIATAFAIQNEGSVAARGDLSDRLPQLMRDAYKVLENKNQTMIKDALSQSRSFDDVDNFVAMPKQFGTQPALRHAELRTILVTLSGKLYSYELREKNIIKPIGAYLKLAKSAVEDNSLSQDALYSLLLNITTGRTYEFIRTRMEIQAPVATTWVALQRAEMKHSSEEEIRDELNRLMNENPGNGQKIHNLFSECLTLSIKLYSKVRDKGTKTALAVATAVDYYKKYLAKFRPLQLPIIQSECERELAIRGDIVGTIEECDLWAELSMKFSPASSVSKHPNRRLEALETRVTNDEASEVTTDQVVEDSYPLRVEETKYPGNNQGAIPRRPMKCFLCAQAHGWRQCPNYKGITPSAETCSSCHCKHLPLPCVAKLEYRNPNSLGMQTFNKASVNESYLHEQEEQEQVYLYYDDEETDHDKHN